MRLVWKYLHAMEKQARAGHILIPGLAGLGVSGYQSLMLDDSPRQAAIRAGLYGLAGMGGAMGLRRLMGKSLAKKQLADMGKKKFVRSKDLSQLRKTEREDKLLDALAGLGGVGVALNAGRVGQHFGGTAPAPDIPRPKIGPPKTWGIPV